MARPRKNGLNGHRDYVRIAEQYCDDVIQGKIPACQWVKAACQRQIADRQKAETDPSYPFEFRRDKADFICLFVEKLPHIKGEWAKRGEKLILQPWQVFIYTTVFGWISKSTGLRRFRTAYIECARKNGKSSLSAPIGIYMLSADGEQGAEVYSAATTRDQAKIIWETAKSMTEREPGLREAFGVSTTAHSIAKIATGSRFQALSAEGNSLDGLNIHCALVDELHAHRTRKVYDVLETARAARQQPLLWSITTAGSHRSGICYEQRSYVTKILAGTVQDESYFGVIYTIDDEDDWQDERNWIKANPNLEVSVSLEELRNLALKAKKMPSALSNFLTKHLSVWVNADAPLFNMAAWEACANRDLSVDDFKGEPCWIALDLAPRHDFCALGLLFQRDGDYYWFVTHYLNEDEIEESGNASFAGWEREGWIKACPGNQTDYGDIEADLAQITSDFQVEKICYDPFNAAQFATRAVERGYPMVEVRAIVQNFSEATKKLDALIVSGKIHHDGNPLMAWEMSNVVGHYDRKDNVYPVKERPENKIDGPVTLIMTLNRAMLDEGGGQSVYETKELLVL